MESDKAAPNIFVSAVISAGVLALTFMPAAFPANRSWQALDREIFPLLLLPGRVIVMHAFGSKDVWAILLLNWFIYALLMWPLTGDVSEFGLQAPHDAKADNPE